MKRSLLLGLMVLNFASGSRAAAIAWSVGPAFGGPTGFQGILTNGSLVAAVNLGESVPLTVDPTGINITFTPIEHIAFPELVYPSGSPGSTDAAWNSIIDSTQWTFGNFTVPGFLTGLSVGRSYQVQFFASDTRTCCSARTSTFSNGFEPPSAPVAQGTFTSVVGTFIADDIAQTIAFATSSHHPILSAYVLRDLTPSGIPEPSSLVLLGSALAAAVVYAKRRADR